MEESSTANLCKGLMKIDLSHTGELGTANFSEVENIKNEMLTIGLSLIDKMAGLKDEVPFEIKDIYEKLVLRCIDTFGGYNNRITDLVSKVHQPIFPADRSNILVGARQFRTDVLPQLWGAQFQLRVMELEHLIAEKDVAALKSELSRLISEAQKIVSNLQDKALDKGLEKASTTFSALIANHKLQEQNWFNTFIVSSIFTGIVLLFVVFQEYKVVTLDELALKALKNVLLLGMGGLAMRVSLKKYNLERNLRIIYDHRTTVIDQYRLFESAIGDDADAKNNLRLEIARHIFSDPVTGYITDSSTQELSVNPVVNLIERAVAKST